MIDTLVREVTQILWMASRLLNYHIRMHIDQLGHALPSLNTEAQWRQFWLDAMFLVSRQVFPTGL